MCSTRISTAIAVAAVLCLPCSAAWADLPGERTIQYKIRDTPSDADSTPVFIVELDLSASDMDGDSVGWKINEMRFLDKNPTRTPLKSWVKSSPTVSTQDGLWWIDHADPDDPQVSEFDVTPLLEDTATAQGSYNDLDFSFQGAGYSGSPVYGGNVAGLTHEFTIVGAATPEEEGDDEPAELDEVADPPGS